MDDMTRLGDLILKHWTAHRPGLIEELERTNQLPIALRQAQEQTGDLLYRLTVIQKMEYHAAWELAMKEWAFLPGEDRAAPLPLERPALDRPLFGKPSPSQTPPHPAISE
jgi:hypothetical protein